MIRARDTAGGSFYADNCTQTTAILQTVTAPNESTHEKTNNSPALHLDEEDSRTGPQTSP